MEDVTKRYLMVVAGKNLGVIMRALFGMGKPRTLQTEGGGGFSSVWAKIGAIFGIFRSLGGVVTHRIKLADFSPTEIVARSGVFVPHPLRIAG